MDWSLNEIEGLARKAVRGAGYGWGHAEEAGKATRWICAAGWPGAELLADLLTRLDGVAYDDIRPESCTGPWRARLGTLCPLITGAAICDLAPRWASGETLQLGAVAAPLFLVPYMVWSADRTGVPLMLEWPGLKIIRGAGQTGIHLPDPATLSLAQVEGATLTPATSVTGLPLIRAYRAHVSADPAARLQQLAHRTYAPETEESRRAGAGAGLSDND
ncbi:DUF3726 domain-containing protein [Roseovarius aestuariivivens]|uniref:DUF3726 domain-containing protein n=1 Tax=Roseovarius aestuariivivens TaxID=1888910 RepID=UPI001080473C|nr:DUF3726 domain-containing protein [Roseovarius aestuariivivens]